MFRIMSMTLMNMNPQKEIFHHYDFPIYTASKSRDPKLDTYRRITLKAEVVEVEMEVAAEGNYFHHHHQHD